MFLDHFNDGSVGLLQDPGNGTITEPAGTQLRLYAPDGVNNNLSDGASKAIIAYKGAGIISPHRVNGPFRFDLKFDQYTTGNNTTVAGILVWQGDISDAYAYELGYYRSESQIIISRWLGTFVGGTRLGSSGGKTIPNGTTPHIYRIFVNPLDKRVPLTDESFGTPGVSYIYPNSVGFAYSTDNGATWTWWHQRTAEFRVDWIGPYLRNWSSGGGITHEALFDYFNITAYDWDAKQHLYVPSTSSLIDPPRDQDKRAFGLLEDDARTDYHAKGRTAFELPDQGRGALVPGPQHPAHAEDNQAGERPILGFEDEVGIISHPEDDASALLAPGPVGQFRGRGDAVPDHAGLEDNLEQLPQSGNEDWFSVPEIKEAFRFKDGIGSQVGGLEDELFWELDEADYQDDKLDGDGNELLYNNGATEAVLIDTTKGGFGDPVAGAHWGAARNGLLYAAGVQCGTQGVNFGTLAGGKNRSAWRFASAGAMEREPLYNSNPAWFSEAHSADNEIEHTLTGSPASWLPNIDSWMRFYVDGDFDIEYEYDELTGNHSTGNCGVYLGVSIARNSGGSPNYSYVYMRALPGGTYEAHAWYNGSGGSLGSVAGAMSTARFRITRTSGVYQCYKWDAGDGGWVTVGTTYTNAGMNGPQFVWLGIYANTGYNTHAKMRNFQINAGTVHYSASWFREASGAHRGTREDMPEELAVISTTTSLDLIDTATNKLWMRFIRSGANAFIDNGGNSIVRDIAWVDGILLLAVGRNTTEGQEGNIIVIDFAMNIIRYHRESASTVCGSWYQGFYHHEPGNIVERNAGRNWGGDYDDWHIPDYRTRSVHAFHDAGQHYRAVGTVVGASVHKWLRWNMNGLGVDSDDWDMQYSLSTEVTEIVRVRFFNGELFYCDLTNLYSRDRTNGGLTGWEDNIAAGPGGSFTAEYSKALPGTRATYLYNQYEPAFYQPAATKYVFMPANEGVYRIDWPSGSWELFYGPSGSGATHEILPVAAEVKSISITNDGTYDLMVIGFDTGAESQIYIVKLVDNTIYGISVPKSPTRSPKVAAAV
jgi:hypothetical protein